MREAINYIFRALVLLIVFLTPIVPPLGIAIGVITSLLSVALIFLNRREFDTFFPRISILYLLSTVPSIFFSVNFTKSVLTFSALLLIIALSLELYYQIRGGEISSKSLIRLLLSAYVIVLIVGFMEYILNFHGKGRIGIITFSFGGREALTSTWSYINRYANYLDLMIPLNFALLLSEKGGKRFLLSLTLISAVFQLLKTTSVGGTISNSVAILVILSLTLPKIGVPISLVLTTLGAISWKKLFKLATRYGVWDQRVYGWTHDIPQMLKGRWLVGVGLGCYRIAALKVDPMDKGLTTHGHNIFLHHLAVSGILGLLGIAFLLFSNIYRGIAEFLKRRDPIILGITGALISITLHGLVETIIDFAPITLLFWIYLAILNGRIDQQTHEGEGISGEGEAEFQQTTTTT